MQGKKIILGVTGSIAAYKSALLVRLLVKQGAEVRVVQTKASQEFITPLTLSTLSKHPVLTEFVDSPNGEWNNHVELGLWADAIIIAPASANTLAKMASGTCDNLLLATYLSARCPVFVAPAMDLDMYLHPTTQANLQTLQANGNMIIDPEDGELASGLVGVGRLAEPEEIVTSLKAFFQRSLVLKNKRVLITSGPTHEAIDPVRFIGNRSTGKMGKALAESAAALGAHVDFISGPVNELPKHPKVDITTVQSADQMYEAALGKHQKANLAIFTAAVADYRVKEIAVQKIKKNDEHFTLELIKNKDIALELGKKKTGNQLHLGFALETENESAHAQQKLAKKNFDFIALNSLNDKGAGFGHDTNKVTVYNKQGQKTSFDLMDKKVVANKIFDLIIPHVK